MAKVSRRDFLKLLLGAAGIFLVWLLQKVFQPMNVEPEPEPVLTVPPSQTPVTFSQWGQENLVFAALSTSYNNLR